MTKKSSNQTEPLALNSGHARKIASFFIGEPFNYIDETMHYVDHLGDCILDSDLFDSKDDRVSFLMLKQTITELQLVNLFMSYQERRDFAEWALFSHQKESEVSNG